MADIIQLRRDTAANWTSVNPTMANGEMGYETDTGRFKIGDGVTAWTSLAYTEDKDAIHDDVTGEINALVNKATPVGADELIIEDSAASWGKKKVAMSNLPGGTDPNAIHDNVAGEINAIAAKGTPVGADEMVIEDSAAGWAKKKVALTNLPSGSHTLDGGQSDVVITSVADDEVLAYDSGGNWINQTAAEAGLATDSHAATHLPSGSDPLTTAAPVSIDADDSQQTGTAESFSRSDHQHAIVCDTPGSIQCDDAPAEGSSNGFARGDHTHGITCDTPNAISGVQAGAEGSSTGFARGDHDHAISHSISDNALVTVDSASVANGEIARFTASGLESRDNSEMKTQLGYLTDVIDDTTPQLGGNIDLNDLGIILTGETIDGAVSTGDLVYYDGTDWNQVDADAEATCNKWLGIYLGSNEVLVQGFRTTTGLTAGDIYYASTTPGGITNTAPSGTGDIVRIIGYARSTTLLYFDPDKTYIEVA